MRVAILFAAILVGASQSARCETITYALDDGGDGIQLSKSGGMASGFTFGNKCSHQMLVGGFKTAAKIGPNDWAITVPSQSTTAVEALLLDERNLTWKLYDADSSEALPWSEINAGILTRIKSC